MKPYLLSFSAVSLGAHLLLAGPYLRANLPKTPAVLTPHPNKVLPTVLDTLLDVGGHKLHFRIWRGKLPVILFESGGGDELSVWKSVLAPIYRATGATLITYDRAGFGKSEIDSSQLTINQQIISLKNGLSKLGLDRKCLVVAHSLGGIFATAFAARYPTQVKGAVLLDATQAAFWTPSQLNSFLTQYASVQAQTRKTAPGRYWMYATMPQLVAEMHQTVFPHTIPAIAVMADQPFYPTADETTRWRQAQQQFVAAAPNRKLLLAKGSGHYVMNDRPDLVIKAISALYKDIKPKNNTRKKTN